MNRRELLKKSALAGAALAITKSGKRLTWALAGPAPPGAAEQTQPSSEALRGRGSVDPQLLLRTMDGVELHHPKHITAPRNGVLYANSVIRFTGDGSVTFVDGRTVSAAKGTSFKLKVFSNRNGTIVRRLLVRATDKEAALARGAARKAARLSLKRGR